MKNSLIYSTGWEEKAITFNHPKWINNSQTKNLRRTSPRDYFRITKALVAQMVMVKNLPANAEDTGSIPGLGRPPGEGNGNPCQYSCLGNFLEKGA